MATNHEIEILIHPDGSIKLDIKGMKGPVCAPIIGKLAKDVGEIVEERNKPEFYQQQGQQQKKLGGA